MTKIRSNQANQVQPGAFQLTRLSALLALALTTPAMAVTVADDLTQGHATLNWIPLANACLTAGDGTGSIPACTNLSGNVGGWTGSLPDAVGQGALRLTDNNGFRTGAIVSNFTFPASQGISVTFQAMVYGGDGGSSSAGAAQGADGMSFFLMDGSLPAPTQLGGSGGSLGYSCSNQNGNYNGLIGAYVGLGIDEYGNFLNGTAGTHFPGDNADNTATSDTSNTSHPYSVSAPRIGMRGAGNVAWSWLTANYPQYYPSGLSSGGQQSAVQSTCAKGYLLDYSKYDSNNGTVSTPKSGGSTIPVLDYAAIPGAALTLPSGTVLANQESASGSVTRAKAIPITYNLQITGNGLLTLQYSYNNGAYQPILTKQSISASNGSLPANLRFGFSGSTGGSTNIHEITCFQAQPADTTDSSAGVNTQQSAQIRTGTQVYLSYFHTNNWWGQLTSTQLMAATDGSGTVSLASQPQWDASCDLTGFPCSGTNPSTGTLLSPSSRVMLTFDDSSSGSTSQSGIPFEWSALNSAQKNAIDSANASSSSNSGSPRMSFLRGDRSQEVSNGGAFRNRTSVLGDIQHSNPSWVGPPAAGYPDPNHWTDYLYSSATLPEKATGAQSYLTFARNRVTRENVVYSGANDGILHGFRSGSYDGQVGSTGSPFGTYITSTYPNDGQEVLAYMPAAVVKSIHNSSDATQDYSSPQYSHAFYEDASPGTGDLFYNNAWHTWLVDGQGAGGSAIFVLDITDPANFSESNASSLALAEWNTSSISCTTDTSSFKCKNSLGSTYGTPVVRRFHNGKWGFIFGNGYGSSNGHAGIYVVTVDPTLSGGKPVFTIYYLDANAGPNNGIAFVTPADLDGDHVTDYVYAGDLLGKVWRFDLTSNSPSSWAVTNYGTGTTAQPLFATPSFTSGSVTTNQPITTKVIAVASPSDPTNINSTPRVLIEFGTGREFPLSNTTPTSYAPGQQSVYGVWDWNLSNWNTLAPSSTFAALTSSQGPGSLTYSPTASNPVLVSQTISLIPTSGTTPAERSLTGNPVCWKGASSPSSCSAFNQYGWVVNFPTSGEQLIYNPILFDGALIMSTTIPPSTNACSSNKPTGWTLAFSSDNGGTYSKSYFPNSSGNFNQVGVTTGSGSSQTTSLVSVMGVQLNGTGTPSIVSNTGKASIVTQTYSGVGTTAQTNSQNPKIYKRVNWVQLR